jgi:hypothetical protein
MAIECLETMFGGKHKLLKQPLAAGLSIKLLRESANFHRHAETHDPLGRLSLSQAKSSIARVIRAALKTI